METLDKVLEGLKIAIQTAPDPSEQALAVVQARPISQRAGQTALSNAETPQRVKIKDRPDHQNQITRLLEQTYSTLRKFGEAGDTMDDRDAMFQLVLGEFTIEEVNRAFGLYLMMHTEIPTPAEIVGYIDPWKRKLCSKMYSKLVNLRRKRVEEGSSWPLSDTEEEFIYRYEAQQLGDY